MVFLVCGFLNVHGKSTIKATDTRFLPEASSMSLFRPKIKKKCYVSNCPTDNQKNALTVIFFLHTNKNKLIRDLPPENPSFYIHSLHNLSIPIFRYCWSSSFIYLFPIWLHPYKPNQAH